MTPSELDIAAHTDVKRLGEELAEQESRLESSKRRVIDLESQLGTIRRDLKDRDAQIAALQRQAGLRESTLETLKMEVRSAQATGSGEASGARDALRAAQQRIASLEAEVARASEAGEGAKASVEAQFWKDEASRLKRALEAAQAQGAAQAQAAEAARAEAAAAAAHVRDAQQQAQAAEDRSAMSQLEAQKQQQAALAAQARLQGLSLSQREPELTPRSRSLDPGSHLGTPLRQASPPRHPSLHSTPQRGAGAGSPAAGLDERHGLSRRTQGLAAELRGLAEALHRGLVQAMRPPTVSKTAAFVGFAEPSDGLSQAKACEQLVRRATDQATSFAEQATEVALSLQLLEGELLAAQAARDAAHAAASAAAADAAHAAALGASAAAALGGGAGAAGERERALGAARQRCAELQQRVEELERALARANRRADACEARAEDAEARLATVMSAPRAAPRAWTDSSEEEPLPRPPASGGESRRALATSDAAAARERNAQAARRGQLGAFGGSGAPVPEPMTPARLSAVLEALVERREQQSARRNARGEAAAGEGRGSASFQARRAAEEEAEERELHDEATRLLHNELSRLGKAVVERMASAEKLRGEVGSLETAKLSARATAAQLNELNALSVKVGALQLELTRVCAEAAARETQLAAELDRARKGKKVKSAAKTLKNTFASAARGLHDVFSDKSAVEAREMAARDAAGAAYRASVASGTLKPIPEAPGGKGPAEDGPEAPSPQANKAEKKKALLGRFAK